MDGGEEHFTIYSLTLIFFIEIRKEVSYNNRPKQDKHKAKKLCYCKIKIGGGK